MRKILFLVLLYGCAPRPTAVYMSNQQQTDSIISYRKQLDYIFKGFVFLDKNFRIDTAGKTTLSDTIFINSILTRKKYLQVGTDTAGVRIAEIEERKVVDSLMKVVDSLLFILNQKR